MSIARYSFRMGSFSILRTSTSGAPLISVIDDDESVRSSLVLLLRSRGFRSQGYASGEAFLGVEDGLSSQCLVVDVRLKGMTGLALQACVRSQRPTIPIILISAHRDEEAERRALKAGALAFLIKPFSEDTLLSSIASALSQ